ncbi:MAG: DTDP-4-dehydrorhamnose reductase [Candidatus Collierbacteria bacterium GW2011_GWF2_44_15]|uniref:dTDP-4-dehydrorhamnose reductase n=2 Tax=Candidatus Collieribacteriota TaxID=1752725 RepID=A0A0G1HA89_9BACT|nr:MAG: DTDP-4-dehydrorhamnose reductase [Candidatus Collierbacteria bacterium GW2011_GWF1_44_12]KKT44316.1 MAG: DTDP-4-dehydrorhamnose reductase [Candidatus Collierbacteria bacterium GW2011_GWF2_44_15]
MEKILVTGANGLVGSRFIELSKNKYKFLTPDLPDFDITDVDSVYKTLLDFSPDWVINFAAFTDVNAAESQPHDESSLAWKVNVNGVENLVNAFLSDKIIHISTDMVFSGDLSQPGPFDEYDKTQEDPLKLTWYGYTKNQAEKVILKHGGSILRIIYPVRAHFPQKLDYIRAALARYKEGKMYPLFYDQQIGIAFIDEISETLNQIVEQDARGIFHASSDTTNPLDLITYTLEQLGEEPKLEKASIVEFLKTQPNPYRYPQFGGLRVVSTESELGVHFSTWQTVVEKLIAQGLSLE